MMKDDPIISEIREIRHRISEKCDHDPKKLVEYYIKLQEASQERLIKSPKESHIPEK
jgi:hypothetical protein